MKILLLSTAIEGGGAALAALRLYQALQRSGANVRLLVLRRPKNLSKDLVEDSNIAFLEDKHINRLKSKFFFVAERVEIMLRNGFKKEQLWQYSTASFGLNINKHPWVSWADILHLQWINHGMLSLSTIVQLGKPIVWTLHDLFPVTALAHLPKFDKHSSPLFSSNYAQEIPLELSCQRKAKIVIRKSFLEQSKIHYIAVSSFVKDLAEQIIQSNDKERVKVIAPALNLSSYKRKEDQQYFPWYNEREHYILISAARLDDPIKGANLLIKFSQELQIQAPELAAHTTLLLLGNIKEASTFQDLALKHICLGHISETQTLQELYQLADITLSTSLFETFGLTLIESLAMGTPVISFDCGGARDIIQNGKNGYLIEAFDPQKMAQKVINLIKEQNIIAGNCQISVQNFDFSSIALQHINYYQDILRKDE